MLKGSRGSRGARLAAVVPVALFFIARYEHPNARGAPLTSLPHSVVAKKFSRLRPPLAFVTPAISTPSEYPQSMRA